MTYREEKLVQFLNELNNFHPYLSFTHETSESNVYSLNLNVTLKDNVIHTDLYINPTTDGHQYLHYQSSHPHHIKVSIPNSQALRVNRICSSEKDFRAHICRMKEWFLARVYPEKVVNNQIDKIVFNENLPVKKFSENGIPFVSTYHPKVKDLGKLIKDLLPFRYRDKEVQVFSPTPIAYKSARKIKDNNVRSKLYLVGGNAGCQGCGGSMCQVCANIKVNGIHSFYHKKHVRSIIVLIVMINVYLIYLFNSRTCGKQYTGKTTNHFRSRWNKYKSEARKAESGNIENVKHKYLQSHFSQPDHKDLEVRLIDKTESSDPTKREFYWMRTLKTLYPDGLNIESDY